MIAVGWVWGPADGDPSTIGEPNMMIRAQIALNVDGLMVQSGHVVDVPDEDAAAYVRQGLALPAIDSNPVETRGDDVAAPKKATRARKTSPAPAD